MADSATAKVNRASQRIKQLDGLIERKPPFTYMLETNYQTGERATYAKRNDKGIEECALACGEIVQDLRSALDHAYWEIVSKCVPDPKQQKKIQFPFCAEKSRMSDALKSRLADRVSTAFEAALTSVKPYGDADGDQMLYLVDLLNNAEKHRELVAVGDYTHIVAEEIKRQVPDFPLVIQGKLQVGMNHRDVVWSFARPMGPIAAISERRLNVPVATVLPASLRHGHPSMSYTLRQMEVSVKAAIATMRAAA